VINVDISDSDEEDDDDNDDGYGGYIGYQALSQDGGQAGLDISSESEQEEDSEVNTVKLLEIEIFDMLKYNNVDVLGPLLF
jgi:hypothetical protein